MTNEIKTTQYRTVQNSTRERRGGPNCGASESPRQLLQGPLLRTYPPTPIHTTQRVCPYVRTKSSRASKHISSGRRSTTPGVNTLAKTPSALREYSCMLKHCAGTVRSSCAEYTCAVPLQRHVPHLLLAKPRGTMPKPPPAAIIETDPRAYHKILGFLTNAVHATQSVKKCDADWKPLGKEKQKTKTAVRAINSTFSLFQKKTNAHTQKTQKNIKLGSAFIHVTRPRSHAVEQRAVPGIPESFLSGACGSADRSAKPTRACFHCRRCPPISQECSPRASL